MPRTLLDGRGAPSGLASLRCTLNAKVPPARSRAAPDHHHQLPCRGEGADPGHGRLLPSRDVRPRLPARTFPCPRLPAQTSTGTGRRIQKVQRMLELVDALHRTAERDEVPAGDEVGFDAEPFLGHALLEVGREEAVV